MYVIGRIQLVTIPQSTWNHKLVNVQRTSRNHRWDLSQMVHAREANEPPPPGPLDDLVRIPANSKTRVSLEEEYGPATQGSYLNRFLAFAGTNFDLVQFPHSFRPAPTAEEYSPPTDLSDAIAEHPEDLEADLYRCTASDLITRTFL